jgi:hypothetical protein
MTAMFLPPPSLLWSLTHALLLDNPTCGQNSKIVVDETNPTCRYNNKNLVDEASWLSYVGLS